MDTSNSSPVHETTNSSNGKEGKRQQFTNKQRMDMYAFCVLELEMHSNKVSIKKQQQAIQRVLYEQKKEGQKTPQQQAKPIRNHNNQQAPSPPSLQSQQLTPPNQTLPDAQDYPPPNLPPSSQTMPTLTGQHQNGVSETKLETQHQERDLNQDDNSCNLSVVESKTLLQLQQEVAMTRKCYSDYQKTQVLTSSMLRDVQKRFAKYYPDSAIPSRTTIKHVFEKCVAHGTVENIKTPRKATKIPQGDEIEYLLIHEPQLSLRQMALKLNVSTGTVSRRCKALGLVPESVTIKHQQLATARRQRQIKQLESQSKAVAHADSSASQKCATAPVTIPEQIVVLAINGTDGYHNGVAAISKLSTSVSSSTTDSSSTTNTTTMDAKEIASFN